MDPDCLLRLLEDDRKSKYFIRAAKIFQVTLIKQSNLVGTQSLSHAGMQFTVANIANYLLAKIFHSIGLASYYKHWIRIIKYNRQPLD